MPGASKVVHIPTRRCLACRVTAPKAALVRFAASSGTVVVDPLARRPGRGAYVCRGRECLEQALRREGAPLRRALRMHGQPLEIDVDGLVAAFEAARAGHDAGREAGDRLTGVGAARSDA